VYNFVDFRSDLYEDEEIQLQLNYEPPWIAEYAMLSAGATPEDTSKYGVTEQESLYYDIVYCY